jgi:hypothetical protein
MSKWNRPKREARPTRAMIDALYGTTDIIKPNPLPAYTTDSLFDDNTQGNNNQDSLFDPPNSAQDGTKQNSRHDTRIKEDKRLETKPKRTAESKPKRKSIAGQSEWKIQASMVAWFGRNFRDQRDLLCANNNNSQNRIAGARNNMIGIRSGRADLTLYWLGRAYHIEVKTPNGTQSESQREFQRLIESNGFTYHIVRSKDEFIELIRFITNRDCSDDTAES